MASDTTQFAEQLLAASQDGRIGNLVFVVAFRARGLDKITEKFPGKCDPILIYDREKGKKNRP